MIANCRKKLRIIKRGNREVNQFLNMPVFSELLKVIFWHIGYARTAELNGLKIDKNESYRF